MQDRQCSCMRASAPILRTARLVNLHAGVLRWARTGRLARVCALALRSQHQRVLTRHLSDIPSDSNATSAVGPHSIPSHTSSRVFRNASVLKRDRPRRSLRARCRWLSFPRACRVGGLFGMGLNRLARWSVLGHVGIAYVHEHVVRAQPTAQLGSGPFAGRRHPPLPRRLPSPPVCAPRARARL